MNRFATGSLRPDRTYLLDIDPQKARERLLNRVNAKLAANRADLQGKTQGQFDRIEGKDLAFHERVRAGFLQIAQKEPERILVIDASRDIEEIFLTIKNDVEVLLQRNSMA
jgi:dTMP kinase